jgi:hypothetical protein
MVVIPRQQPVLENLNIYYLNVRKLLEHFQGEIGSGGVFFKSAVFSRIKKLKFQVMKRLNVSWRPGGIIISA